MVGRKRRNAVCYRALKSTIGRQQQEGRRRKWQVDIEANCRSTRGALYGALSITASLWGSTMFLAVFTYETTPTCAVHDKKRSHTLLNEDGDPGKNNNLELNTDVEYRAERMRNLPLLW
jgi:hypothetical protein